MQYHDTGGFDPKIRFHSLPSSRSLPRLPPPQPLFPNRCQTLTLHTRTHDHHNIHFKTWESKETSLGQKRRRSHPPPPSNDSLRSSLSYRRTPHRTLLFPSYSGPLYFPSFAPLPTGSTTFPLPLPSTRRPPPHRDGCWVSWIGYSGSGGSCELGSSESRG